MSGKGCGAGCLSLIAAFFISVGIDTAISGPIGAAVLTFLMGIVPLWMAIAMWQGHLRDARQREAFLHERRERFVLQVAAQNQGRVTPALVAMNSPEIGIAEAKALLDQLCKDGFCAIDSDSQGNDHYQFDLGQARRRERELRADDWVNQESRRMTGSDADDRISLDP